MCDICLKQEPQHFKPPPTIKKKKKDKTKNNPKKMENLEPLGDGVAADDSCICAVDQRSPYVASKSESKELKSKNGIANAALIIPDLRFVAVSTFRSFSPDFSNDLSYSSTLKSLLPSRAPPRL